MAEKICESLDIKIDDDNRGVLEAGFRVIKWTWCPAVLVEVGFMSNFQTARKLKRADYRQAIAEAIADGIIKFKEKCEKTTGFSKNKENGSNLSSMKVENNQEVSGANGAKD